MLFNKARRKGEVEGCFFGLFLLLIFGVPLCIGGYKVYSEHQEKIAKANADILQDEKNKLAREQRAAERHSISGVIAEVQYSTPHHSGEWTRVKFDDGREKSFIGLPNRGIAKGSEYTFHYDGNSRLITVDVK